MAGEYFSDDVAGRRTRYDTIKAALKTDRSSFEAHWRELGDFLLPRRTRFWAGDRNRGDKRNQNIIDSTGRFAVRTLQSGLHAGLTSPARPWMKLTTPDPDLAKSPAVKQWLSVVTQRMLVVFQQTNLYNSLPIAYGDMGVFGTAAIGVVEDTKDLFRCYPYPIGTYALGLDARGLATSFLREYQLSVRQVVEQFGLTADRKTIDWTKLSPHVKNCWDKAAYEEPVDLTWLVLPNPTPNPQRAAAKYKPWTSCHFEDRARDRFLRESGFNSFPILGPRWEITGEDTYGTDCPGMTALPDVKGLQAMQRAKAKAIQKMIDPPLQAPTALKTQKTSLLPGDITYYDQQQGGIGVRSLHEVRIDIGHFVQDIASVQYRIQRAFFEDLFLMLAQSDGQRGSQPITAREVAERHEEKLLALGPVLERTNDELLEPLIDRVYGMMDAAGLIPAPPPELEGVVIKAEYTSIMAQAQKLVGVVGLDRFMGAAAQMAPIFPGVLHKINVYRVVDLYGDALGIDPGIVRTDADADALAQQEAQAAQAANEAKQAQQMAAAMHSAGTTPMDGDTALSRLVGGITGSAGQATPGGAQPGAVQ